MGAVMTDLRNRAQASASATMTAAAPPRRDGNLLEAIAAGDQAALAEAYSRYASGVHALARGVCGHTRAEDVTQEIFLNLWNNPQRYDPTRGSLRAYLLVQAHSRAVDVLRRDNARATKEAAENRLHRGSWAEADAAALAVLERAAVDELVTALPETERQPIVLAYFGGHTYREVARLLHVPEGTIKSRIRSGLKHLRDAREGQITPT